MKDFSNNYLKWYEKNRSLINKISIFNVVMFTLATLLLFITDHELFTLTVWLWGLSVASLVVNYDK